MTMISFKQTLLFSICCVFSVSAWSSQHKLSRVSFSLHSHDAGNHFAVSDNESLGSGRSQTHDTRRRFFTNAMANLCVMGAVAPAVIAAEKPLPPGTKYISGKTPVPPGETPKKSDSTKGTKKDPDFLRSVADCRSKCQSQTDKDGLARSKEDCLSECQDICCKTYEQCTFNIVPRI